MSYTEDIIIIHLKISVSYSELYIDSAYITMIVELWSYFELSKDPSHLTLMGEIWGIFCEYLTENCLHKHQCHHCGNINM